VRYHRREQGARRAARDAEHRRLLESALGLPKRRTQEAYQLTRLGILAGRGNDLFRLHRVWIDDIVLATAYIGPMTAD